MDDTEREGDEPFEGVDIDSPLGRIRLGRGGGRRGVHFELGKRDSAYKEARRRVRRRLSFYRHLTTYVALNLVFLAFDGLTGGGFWVQWVAGIWGIFLGWNFLSAFVFPNLWGAEVERRMIERELKRHGEPVEDK